jgi:hypothetical protein
MEQEPTDLQLVFFAALASNSRWMARPHLHKYRYAAPDQPRLLISKDLSIHGCLHYHFCQFTSNRLGS